MPKSYPQEFRDDVVKVVRRWPDGTTLEQIVHDFGVHPMTLSKWLRRPWSMEPTAPVTHRLSRRSQGLKTRFRPSEQENEELHRAAAYLGRATSFSRRVKNRRGVPAPGDRRVDVASLGRPVRRHEGLRREAAH